MQSFSHRESVDQSGREERSCLLHADDADTFLSLNAHEDPPFGRIAVEREESLREGSPEGESEGEEGNPFHTRSFYHRFHI